MENYTEEELAAIRQDVHASNLRYVGKSEEEIAEVTKEEDYSSI